MLERRKCYNCVAYLQLNVYRHILHFPVLVLEREHRLVPPPTLPATCGPDNVMCGRDGINTSEDSFDSLSMKSCRHRTAAPSTVLHDAFGVNSAATTGRNWILY